MKNATLFIALIMLLGCAQQERKYLNELNGSGGGVFRGVSIKDGVNKIKQIEEHTYLIADEEVYLKYVYPFDEQNKEKGRYEIEYYFDGEDQLHEIIINAFVTDKKAAKQLFEDLKVRFTGEYGDHQKNKDGYLIWQGKTPNTNQLEIALLDDSKNNEATGYITLQINDFDY